MQDREKKDDENGCNHQYLMQFSWTPPRIFEGSMLLLPTPCLAWL